MMRLNLFFLRTFPWLLATANAVNDHTKLMNIQRRKLMNTNRRATSMSSHEIIFAVRQKNLDIIESELLDRCTPGHSNYEQWLSFSEIGLLTSNKLGATKIKDWLVKNNASITWESAHSDYIKATAKIQVWEYLFNTVFHEWNENFEPTNLYKTRKLDQKSPPLVLAKEYTIPAAVSMYLSAAFNTIQPPPILSFRRHLKWKDNSTKDTIHSDGISLQGNINGYNGRVTIAFLNSFYKIQSNKGDSNQTQAVFQTKEEKFSQNDLLDFQKKNGLPLQRCNDRSGGTWTTDDCKSGCLEGNLDTQYIMGIAQDTATIFWYDGNRNPFLSWITEVSNDPNPPLSNSISWGAIEQTMDIDTMNSFNNEAIKLGLRGVTIIVAAGDHGAANINPLSSTCMCDIDSGSSQSNWQGSDWQGKGYFPSFPASCPYVTAVGGTQGPDLGLINEIACSSKTSGGITTGGGWSTYYVQPSWQKETVLKYLNILNSSTAPQPGFNINGRGYPDISLLAVHYEVIIGGRIAMASGTSASAPVMAGYVSLVNAARHKQGKPSIGFLNKMLYEMGMKNNSIYRDVVSGDNKCCGENSNGIIPCCSTGFSSESAWDPVSGWGSIDYPTFASIFAVVAPYNGSAPLLSRTNRNQLIITRKTVMALFYIVLIIFIVMLTLYCIFRCFKNRDSV